MKVSGPCFLATTLAGLVHAQPRFLDGAFTENDDGSVTVRFFAKSRATGKYVAVYERVDRAVPRWKNGHAFSMQSRDEDELWPALLEKAYAKHKGSYQTFANGGIPGDAMTLLTGKPSAYHVVAERSANQLFNMLRASLHHGHVVVAGTYSTEAFRGAASRTRARDAHLRGAMSFLREEPRPSYTGTSVFAGHAYTVWAVKEEDGRRYVQLREPYGAKLPVAGAPSTGSKRGLFWLPLEQFRVLYEDVHVGG